MLRDTLAQLWEQARAKRVELIGTPTIRMFEAGDAFRRLAAVGAVSGAEKVVAIAGGYETSDGGTFEAEFRGSVADAQPVKEFLEPQLRAARSRTVEATFELSFAEGLTMEGDAAETLLVDTSELRSGDAVPSDELERLVQAGLLASWPTDDNLHAREIALMTRDRIDRMRSGSGGKLKECAERLINGLDKHPDPIDLVERTRAAQLPSRTVNAERRHPSYAARGTAVAPGWPEPSTEHAPARPS